MNIYLFELLAVLAVVIWSVGLLWLISSDVLGALRRRHHHHDDSWHHRPQH